MAKRKTKKSHTTRRRSRMGAINKAGIMDLAYNVAGGIAAGFVSNGVEKALASQSSISDNTKVLIANAVPVIVGFVIPQKNPMLKNLALGMKIAGASKLVGNLTGLAGVGAVYNAMYTTPQIAGVETDYRSSTLTNPLLVAAGI